MKTRINTPAKTNVSDTVLCQEILRLLSRFKAALADIAENYNLTSMQVGVLHAISEGSSSMGKVAQTMHCDASNVTGIIDRLVAVDMVTRQEDPRDRRVKTLALTDKGIKVLDRVAVELPDLLGCDRLNDEERGELYGLLCKIDRP